MSSFSDKLSKFSSLYSPVEHRGLFIKNASDYKYVPPTIMEAAYNVYTQLPTKNASWILEAYDLTDSPQAKLAFEIIGAVLVKESGLVDAAVGALPKLKGLATDASTQVGIAGGLAAFSANKTKNTLEQGDGPNKQNEG